MDKKNKLYIPVNIRRRKEIVDGIGKEEIMKSIIGLLAGFLSAGIISWLKGFQLEILIIIPAAFCFGTLILVRKNARNTSTIDTIKQIIAYNKSQKRYYYQYVNIYEKVPEKVEKDEKAKQREQGLNSQ